MDHRTIAEVSLAGIWLDVLGGLYLAYDLLGGAHGPLRLLTRAVTYSIVFGLGYGLGLGLFFGIASGLATGITIAIELHRAASRGDHYPFVWESIFSLIRAAAFGLGMWRMAGAEFAVAFVILSAGGQIFAYSRGVRPGMDYMARRRPRFTRRMFVATLVRIGGQIVAAMLCSLLAGKMDHAWSFAVRLGLVTGLTTGIGSAINPYIEYYADNLPEKRLGVFGVALVFCGFVMQSVQYWAVILDIPAR